MIVQSVHGAPRFAFDDHRFDQLRYRDVAFAAAPSCSGAADGLHIVDGAVDGARFITFSNTRFSILVFEYSFWKPCSNIFKYSNNRFSSGVHACVQAADVSVNVSVHRGIIMR